MKKYSDLSKLKTPSIIDPNPVRSELANLFRYEKKFQMERMHDPAEVLFSLINALHTYTFGMTLRFPIEDTCLPTCISHSHFWINLLEQTVIL